MTTGFVGDGAMTLDDAFSKSEIAALRSLLVRSQIEEVINRYFRAIDTRDFGLLGEVFSPDAKMIGYFVDGTEQATEGREAIMASVLCMDDWLTSHHGARTISVTVTGDRATANTYAVDALLDTRRRADMVAGPHLLQHGLRYIDALELRPEGWRIVDRKLHVFWQVATMNPAVARHIPMPR